MLWVIVKGGPVMIPIILGSVLVSVASMKSD